MKTKFKIITSLMFLFGMISNTIAQNEIEALRYSQMYWGGTARFMSVGGAFGAVGADVSAISTNPASIGIYKKSDINLTPSVHFSKTISDYNSYSSEDFKYNFNISNFGVVLTGQIGSETSDRPQWKFIQFGFGLNRLANYNNNIVIEGFNDKNSIMNEYIDKSNGITPSDLNKFDTWLAYEAWLTDSHPVLNGGDTVSYNYTSDIQNGGVQQRKTINTKGSMNEWYFSFGGNYSDKLFIGATIGLPYFNYKETSQYQEEDVNDSITGFKSLSINDDLSTNGSGVNLKVGFIVRPADFIRFGGAVHTPTFFYRINDTFSRTIKSNVDEGIFEQKSDILDYKYEINTPLRLMGNLAVLFKTHGFIGIDYEYVDYSKTRLRASDYNFFDENNNVKLKYQTQHIIRAGGELNISPMAIRLGYAYYTNPFKSGINDASRYSISGGLGFRAENYYMDFAYVYTKAKEDYYLYSPLYANATKQNYSSSNFILTMGIKF